MTKNMTVVLPAEIGAETAERAKEEARTIAMTTGAVFAAGGRRLCEALAAYADAAATAHAAPFGVLTGTVRKSRKPFD